MTNKSNSGNVFIEVIVIFLIICLLAIFAIHSYQAQMNDNYAENIIDGAWTLAQQEKGRIDSINLEAAENEGYEDGNSEEMPQVSRSIEWKGYSFKITDIPTPTLIKVETGGKKITTGVCKVLKTKLNTKEWRSIFTSVLILDRKGNEKKDIRVINCPKEEIPALKFYTKFSSDTTIEEEEKVVEEVETAPNQAINVPMPTSKMTTVSPRKTSTSTYSKPSYSCPVGTSSKGKGGIATGGCRCNNVEENWNGRTCEAKPCPEGSSKRTSGKGNWTNIPGCRCNDNTPIWTEGHCVQKSSETKNRDSDDCRWGICQACDAKGNHWNIEQGQNCEVTGLNGICNGNGTCYPTEGRRCNSIGGCPDGQFCNFGGTFDSNKKQKGRFGKTPNVCQNVMPEEFTYKKVTYYYNSEKDLKSWCRAANNKANCLWGYLSKSGAESWCASLGKRLLTRNEMAKVWNELKEELPETYTGYAYWVQEGVWIEGKTGKRSFGKGHPDGYGGRGGVVCR